MEKEQVELMTRWLPTGHVHHPAVAILHDVACLAVNAASCNTVYLEEAGFQRSRVAFAPRRRQVGQLQENKHRSSGATCNKHASKPSHLNNSDNAAGLNQVM